MDTERVEALATPESTMAAPALAYRPRDAARYRPAIGLIGCGSITAQHLAAYRQAGYNVVALCDLSLERARERQARYYPEAAVYADYRDLLRRDDIEVVDIATHPPERAPLIEAALLARKHVLSQKPFVLDLDIGERLVALAERQGVQLAVNQNGRWAPHFAYLREAVRTGLLGQLTSANLTVHWRHTWPVDSPFDDMPDLILYDFAIHWFDIVACFFGDRQPLHVFATRGPAADQQARPPLLAQALIDYAGAQASLFFNAAVDHGPEDRTFLAGTNGSAISVGPSLSEQTVIVYTPAGVGRPALEGSWFPDGFHGTMAELACAVEEKREPKNSARGNLKSLALAFAAIASAHTGVATVPGEIRRLWR